MSLKSFQLALSDLIASPDLCIEARISPEIFFSKYDLTDRELHRLKTVVWQKGMSTNCTLYKANRITPLHTLLPYSSLLLDSDFIYYVEEFWKFFDKSDLQFKNEVEAFGNFIKMKIEKGEIENIYLDEILNLELAMNKLRFSPRRKILAELSKSTNVNEQKKCLRLHPLVAILKFSFNPFALIEYLYDHKQPPEELKQEDCYYLLSGHKEDIDFKKITKSVHGILDKINSGERITIADYQLKKFLSENYVIYN